MKEYEEEYELCPWCGFVHGTPPNEVYHLHPEMILSDRYIVGTVIDFGGFGITYRAWDQNLDAMVAIKEFYPTALVNRVPGTKDVEVYSEKQRKEFSNGLTRFLDEARNTAKFMDHPNIVHVYDFFEENGTAYIVMEYLDGMNLKKYLNCHGGHLGTDETVQILLSVIEALKAIHAKGYLHRDISPDNIFVCKDGLVKLIDFGAARFSTGEEEKTLSIVLKPGYAPPEQYQSKSKQRPWTDIYALGATMYRAVTGEVPEESVNRAVEDVLKTPKEIIPNIPDYIDVSLMVAMSLTPELRFQNVHQFEDAILNKRKVNTIAEDLRRRKRRRLIGISAAGVLILAGAIIAFTSFRNRKMMAELEPATVTIWVEVENEHTEEQEQTRIEEALKEFKEEYPHITIDITYIPEEDYQEEVTRAVLDQTLPILFESTDASEEILQHTVDISETLDLLSLNNYYFLKNYHSYFPNGTQLPTGFLIPYQYENITLEKDEGITDKGSLDEFLNRTSLSYIGNSNTYYQVNNGLPGEYMVQAYDLDNTMCFTDTWSVSDQAEEEEVQAAERIIYYLYSEWAQDVYYIQCPGALPLNQNELQVYMEVNQELDFLQDAVKNNHISEEHPLDNAYE